MNNAVYELLIPRENLLKERLIKLLLIAVLVVLAAVSPLTNFISLLAAVILGTVSYLFILPRFHVEFEYTLVNHNLDIDVIYNKSKRKNLFSIDLKQAEKIAPAGSHSLDSYSGLKTVDCSSRNPDCTPYTIVIAVNQNRQGILFQPDVKMLEQMKSFLPRTLTLQ